MNCMTHSVRAWKVGSKVNTAGSTQNSVKVLPQIETCVSIEKTF